MGDLLGGGGKIMFLAQSKYEYTLPKAATMLDHLKVDRMYWWWHEAKAE